MVSYVIRRLLLLPLTLLCIVLVNFVIINLAPGDPVTVAEISQEGQASRQEEQSFAFGSDDRYLQFREHYGLTLPILFNTWPWHSREQVVSDVKTLAQDADKLSVKAYDALRIMVGDRARYTMDHLLSIVENKAVDPAMRRMALRFFVRGGTRQAVVGPTLSKEQRAYNREVAADNDLLRHLLPSARESVAELDVTARKARYWYEEEAQQERYEVSKAQKVAMFFGHTRFWRYLSKVATLDFGTLRNDSNKTVISEVTKRFKYSLTLAFLPMVITFVLCQIFGMVMAVYHGRWVDNLLNLVFLILYAIPIFVVAPFLIEKVALNGTFPFTDIPIPTSGFNSSESVYEMMTARERLADILRHICLPLVAIMYGGLAAQSRLSRTAFLEVMRQDYVRTARAKGLSWFSVLFKHVGRNAAITIVTAIAGSLGIVLGGSLIVETMFEINGFGKFFYDAVIGRDYNVIMFSALAGAFLSLLGYLLADLAYTLLDPRVTLD